MQTLKADLSSAMKSESEDHSQSVLEVLGYDVDSLTQQYPINVQTSVATSEISAAGLTLQSGSNVQIRLADQNTLIDLERSCVSFTLNISNAYWCPNSITDLFQPILTQIGSVQFSQANGVYLTSMIQGLEKERHELKAMRALGRDFSDAIPIPSDLAATRVGSIQVSTPTACMQACALQKIVRWVQRIRTTADADGSAQQIDFSVPLLEIFPQLRSFEDHVLPIIADQALVLTFQLMPFFQGLSYSRLTDASNAPLGSASSYTMNNWTLTKVYTQLTPQSVNSLMRASFKHLVKGYINTIAPLSNSTIFNVTVPSQSRCKRFICGLFPNYTGASVNTTYATLQTNLTTNNYYNLTPNIMKWGMMSPPLPQISLIQVNFQGMTLTINQQTLSIYQQMGIISWQSSAYPRDVIRRRFGTYLVLDLQRLSKDIFGSRLSQSSTMQIQIQFQNQVQDLISDADHSQNVTLDLPLANFSCQSFLEVVSEVEQTNGIFKYA